MQIDEMRSAFGKSTSMRHCVRLPVSSYADVSVHSPVITESDLLGGPVTNGQRRALYFKCARPLGTSTALRIANDSHGPAATS